MKGEEWTVADRARLAELWGQGISAGAIGHAMGRSKNSVVGAVHRAGLPGRASPIPAKGSGAKPQQQRRAALVGLATVRGVTVMGGGTLEALGVVPVVETPLAPEPAAPKFEGVSRPCCWPIGDPRTKAFRVCEAPGVPGRSYCAAHHAEAYVPMVQRSAANIAADEARRAAAHGRMARHGGFPGPGFVPEWSR